MATKSKTIAVKRQGKGKKVKVVSRPIIRRDDDATMEAALASEEVKSPQRQWANLFGLWGLGLIIAFIAIAASAQEVEDIDVPRVTFREVSFVEAEEMTLGDLAEVEAFDIDTERALRNIYMGTAPRLGQRRAISGTLLAGRLAQAGWGEGTLEVELPSRITVERETREISQSELERIALDLLTEALPHDSASVIIENLRVPRALSIPPVEPMWEISMTANRGVGPVNFQISAISDGEVVGTAQGSAQVDVEIVAAEAVVQIPRGTVITPDMIRTTTARLRSVPNGALLDPQSIIGMETTQSIQANSIITSRAVQPETLVRRGDLVTMIYDSGPLRITDTAESSQNGSAGDIIMVRNIQSQRQVRALVTGERTVRVLF